MVEVKPAFRAAHDTVRARYGPNKDYFFLGLILLAAAFLRFNGLNEPGLWLDEVSYTLAAQSPIIEQITDPDEALGELSSDPTLSAIPFSLSLMLGRSNYLARFPAALFGLLSVAFIYRIGQALFGHMVGLVAALLLATSSFHILYSQEARNYAQFVFFSLGSFWFLFRAVSTNKVSAWSFYALFTFGAVSTNHLMALAVPVQAIFLGLVFVREIFISNYKTVLKVGAGFLLSWVVVVLLRTPWLEDFTARRCTGCDLSGPHLAQTPELVTNWLSSIDVFGGSNSLVMPIFIIFCLLGLGFSLYYHSRAGILLACWLILSVPLTITGLWFISQFFPCN